MNKLSARVAQIWEAGTSKGMWLGLCLTITLLMSLVPLLHLVRSGAGVHGIATPAYMDEYYSPVVREVADGYPLVGNPWFFEHRNDIAQSSILPYWISALPLLAGMPIALAVAMNFSFWSLMIAFLLYCIFRRLGLPRSWSAIGSVYIFWETYFFIIRPVSMQLVYPAFLFFFLAFLRWWEKPSDRYRTFLLGLASALAFYTYGYLYQISLSFLGLAFLSLLYLHDWNRVRRALIVGAWMTLLIIPFIITTVAQLRNPYYLEMMERIALVYTRSVNVLSIREAAALLVFVVFAYVAWRWLRRSWGRFDPIPTAHLLLLGIALSVVSFSCLITGVDVETATHVHRFFVMWLMMASLAVAYILYLGRTEIMALVAPKKILIAVLVVLVGYVNVAHFLPPLTLRHVIEGDPVALQADLDTLPVLEWLDTRSEQSRVVWVHPHNFRLNNNIVYYTKHYVILGNDGLLQLVSNEEVQERYLVASATSEISEKSIAADIWLYGFGGYAVDTADTRNREVRQCIRLRLYVFGIKCGEPTTTADIYAPLFESMHARFLNEIQPNLKEKLQKYHVAYILKDVQNDKDFHPGSLSFVEKVYDDGRFEIYAVN